MSISGRVEVFSSIIQERVRTSLVYCRRKSFTMLDFSDLLCFSRSAFSNCKDSFLFVCLFVFKEQPISSLSG